MKAMAQARIDAQASRAARGLMVLGDDCVHKVMTFLAVADARRGVGAAAKSLRTTARSTTLERTRFSEPYTLRGEKHGVVHALATAMATRPWPKESVTSRRASANGTTVSSFAPPLALSISIHRIQRQDLASAPDAEDDACLKHGLVDLVLDVDRDDVLSTAAEGGTSPGSAMNFSLQN